MESLLFTREDLKKLIVPLIIEQALALSIGLFDTLMVSSCGEAAVSGVSLVDSISTLLVRGDGDGGHPAVLPLFAAGNFRAD